MAERNKAPSQSDQASSRSKAEGEREEERATGRDAVRTARESLDPAEGKREKQPEASKPKTRKAGGRT